jgi:hypothetical protein
MTLMMKRKNLKKIKGSIRIKIDLQIMRALKMYPY